MSDFHFIRPWWLLALAVLFVALYLLKKYRIRQSGWQQLLPPHLSNILLEGKSSSQPLSLVLPGIIGFLAIIALAGPTWKKLPQPVFQTQQGAVLIMDMSYSMYSTDISPNRLTRARYKANDLLTSLNEGEIGLIAYAGDAFSISPLTKDINNIKLLLNSLTPEIMPELGSNPLAALTLANEMLTNAGHVNGHIYWFTDGIENSDIQDITDWSRKHPHRLNILGIGTKTGAPIKLPNGELLKDDSGAIVVPKLSQSALYGAAKRGKGVYQTISNNAADINALVNFAKNNALDPMQAMSNDKDSNNDLLRGDQWEEAGPWLILLILPCVLYYFRRGVLLVALVSVLYFPTPPVYANFWQDLWKTSDQQAKEKFEQEDYEQAAHLFENKEWQGSAQYRAGDYEGALKSFQQSDSANALYNQGNSYAKLQKFDEAIAAYEQALKKDPNLNQAAQNKALVEQLKKQQEQQNQQGQEGESSDEQDNQENSEQQNSQESGQEKQDQNGEQSQQDNQQGAQQNQDQSQNAEQEDNQQQDSEENGENDAEKDATERGDNNEQAEPEEQQTESATDAENSDEPIDESQKTAAQLAQEKREQEMEQKHQQLLNKVTNDPYLLLRNKMQLEYQKRRHEQSNTGVKKKW